MKPSGRGTTNPSWSERQDQLLKQIVARLSSTIKLIYSYVLRRMMLENQTQLQEYKIGIQQGLH